MLLLALLLRSVVHKFSWFDLLQIALLLGVLLMMSRSYAYIDRNLFSSATSMLWVLLLEVFMAVNISARFEGARPGRSAGQPTQYQWLKRRTNKLNSKVQK